MSDRKHKFVYLDKFNGVKEAIKNSFDKVKEQVHHNRCTLFDMDVEISILQKRQQDLKRSVNRNRIALVILSIAIVYLIINL